MVLYKKNNKKKHKISFLFFVIEYNKKYIYIFQRLNGVQKKVNI